ncbi:MAG TPA: MerR family transcriptional regulator [Fibrobacteria bacterium]|nr:MerR family transcriptional regulator [Fibrobacteria bacterium]
MYSLNNSKRPLYHTTGQVAKSLRVSVSTIKRWLDENPGLAGFRTNASGWRLFSSDEIENIREHQRKRKREGKTFRPDTLRPVNDE